MTQPSNTPAAFVAKWKHVKLSERAASQEHVIDLCGLVGHPRAADRATTDQRILAYLLRLNHRRMGDKP